MTFDEAVFARDALPAQSIEKWGLILNAMVVPAHAGDALLYYDHLLLYNVISVETVQQFCSSGVFALMWVNIGRTRVYRLPVDGDID